MKRLLNIALLLGAIALNLSPAGAWTYHVDNSGNDSYTPTQARNVGTPWETIAHAISQSVYGDTILINGGYWDESHTYGSYNVVAVINVSGLTLKAYPGTFPYIDGQPCGIGISGYAITIDSLHITGVLTNTFGGIIVGEPWDSITVKNCRFDSCGQDVWGGSGGICLSAGAGPNSPNDVSYCNIYNNYFYNCNTGDGRLGNDNTDGRDGAIFLENATDNLIHDNTIVNTMFGGGTFVKGHENDNNRFYNNIFIGGGSGINITTSQHRNYFYNNVMYDYDRAGIYLEILPPSEVHWDSIYNNTIYNCASGFIIGGGGGEDDSIYIINNIVYGSSLALYDIGSDISYPVFDYNCYYRPGGGNIITYNGSSYTTTSAFYSATGLEQHSVVANPVFSSTTLGDADFLHLDPDNSPSAVLTGGANSGPLPIYMGAYDPDVAPPVDSIPPTISSIVVSPGQDTCSVHWHTLDENANGVVYYRLHGSGSWSSTGNSGLYATSHYFQLTSLTADREYDYYVYSCDASDNCSTSSTGTFNTLSSGSGGGVGNGQGVLYKKHD